MWLIEWFDLPSKARISVVCGDAPEYISKMRLESTGLIFSDLYEASGMSQVQVQRQLGCFLLQKRAEI
ncbi:hypothetical protein MNBD_GAMMA11-2480 [hydrothermal vent metagenome]|uniref:Uncharacterized protein n=1 Tax=hydrothermal vent metagenome TaxID=652676 RepID=A0A3B0XPF6_9ZZZZ